MRRSVVVQLVAIIACAGLVFASSRLIRPINISRQSLNMIGADSPLENTPPEYAFAIQAFGAFRGILTNIAFIRAEDLKSKGRYFDAMQLADWICTLQPRFPSVWEFQSWNMAWNISVTTYTPEERWNWVYNGARLIRDRGLQYNPRAVNLYKQLAWIFCNKMSENVDQYHTTYKRNWAYRMHLLLGAPPDPFAEYNPEGFEPVKGGIGGEGDVLFQSIKRQSKTPLGVDIQYDPLYGEGPKAERQGKIDTTPTHTDVVKRAAHDFIQKIDDAPRSLDDLYGNFPATREMVARLRAMGVDISDEKLNEDQYWNEAGLSQTFFKRWRRLSEPASLLARISDRNVPDPDEANRAKFDEICGVTKQNPAGEALLRFLQRKVLTEVYKLEPEHMLLVVDTFGPVDWRTVDAHGLYWVTKSILAAEETISHFGNDKLNTSRMIFYSLRNLYLRNKLNFEPNYDNPTLSYIDPTPDLNFVDAMHNAYVEYGPLLDPNPAGIGETPDPNGENVAGAGDTFRSGHTNFLIESIQLLYYAGREREAEKYYEYLRTAYGKNSLGEIQARYAVSLKQFVLNSLDVDFLGEKEARNMVSGLISRSYDELASGNLAQYNAMTNTALQVHAKYNVDPVRKLDGPLLHKKLQPFPDMKMDILRAWLGAPPASAATTVRKARLWNMLPVQERQAVYDDLLPRLTEECKLWQFDVATAFPEPPDMDAYRKTVGRRGPTLPTDQPETPAQNLNAPSEKK